MRRSSHRAGGPEGRGAVRRLTCPAGGGLIHIPEIRKPLEGGYGHIRPSRRRNMSENHWENHVSTPVPPDCGLDVDGARLWLWLQVKHWAGIAPGTCNPCIEVAANKWALLSGGASGGKRTYLLVPTERKKGIE